MDRHRGYRHQRFRLDHGLLAALAALRPDWSIVLVGPVRTTGETAAKRLAAFENVHFLGHRDPSLLAAYQEGCDVGLIPFVQSDATRAMRPLRLLAYLASGLPVVSVPLPELESFQHHVQSAAGPREFADAIAAALSECGPEARAARRRVALAESWQVRARTFWRALEMDWPGAAGRAVPDADEEERLHALPSGRA